MKPGYDAHQLHTSGDPKLAVAVRAYADARGLTIGRAVNELLHGAVAAASVADHIEETRTRDTTS